MLQKTQARHEALCCKVCCSLSAPTSHFFTFQLCIYSWLFPSYLQDTFPGKAIPPFQWTHSFFVPILIRLYLYLKFPNLLPPSQKCPALIPVSSGPLLAPHLLSNPDKVSWRESPSWVILPWSRKRLGRTVLSSKTNENVMKACNHLKVTSRQKEKGKGLFSTERQDEDLNWGKIVTGECMQLENNLPKEKAEPPQTAWSFWSTD